MSPSPYAFTWTEIPEALLVDCAQLVKANSIEGAQYSLSDLSFLLSYFLVFGLVSVISSIDLSHYAALSLLKLT